MASDTPTVRSEASGPNKKILSILFAFVFLDVLGFSIILPLLPFMATQYNVSSTEIGWLVASNAIAQFAAAPVLGKLSDRYGRRTLLLICSFGTFLSFFLLSQAHTYISLLCIRILDGALGGDISLAQTYMSDITDESYRTKGMGILGAALGFGFIFGPAVGSLLSPNFLLAIHISCALAFVNFLVIYISLPETLQSTDLDESCRIADIFPFQSIGSGMLDEKMRPVLIARFIFGLILTSFETFMGLFLLREFGTTPRESGLVLTLFALIYAFIQSPRAVSLSQRYSEKQRILFSFALLCLSMCMWATSHTAMAVIASVVPFSIGSGLVSPLLSSVISKLAGPKDRGGFLGLSASLGSLTRIVSPIIGGAITDEYGNYAPPIFCAFVSLFAFFHILSEYKEKAE